MAEYTKDALDKVIKDHQEKIYSMTQALRLKHVQRERTEAEIVELSEDIKEAETFIVTLQSIQHEIEDQVIIDGLKDQRRKKRERRVSDES